METIKSVRTVGITVIRNRADLMAYFKRLEKESAKEVYQRAIRKRANRGRRKGEKVNVHA